MGTIKGTMHMQAISALFGNFFFYSWLFVFPFEKSKIVENKAFLNSRSCKI